MTEKKKATNQFLTATTNKKDLNINKYKSTAGILM
jgi:hypothetical protein